MHSNDTTKTVESSFGFFFMPALFLVGMLSVVAALSLI